MLWVNGVAVRFLLSRVSDTRGTSNRAHEWRSRGAAMEEGGGGAPII